MHSIRTFNFFCNPVKNSKFNKEKNLVHKVEVFLWQTKGFKRLIQNAEFLEISKRCKNVRNKAN